MKRMIARKLVFLLILSLISVCAFSAESTKNELRFLTIADIHFDPFQFCEKVKPCSLINQLQKADSEEWPLILSSYNRYPQKNKQDTNSNFLKIVLNKVAQQENIQFVLVLGDSLGHQYKRDYRAYSGDRSSAGYISFARKTLQYLTQQLKSTFPNIDVYTLIGNNDSYVGNYITNTNSSFYNDAATIWSGLIKSSANREAMRTQFSRAGYYSVLLSPSLNLRLIALNSVMFSYKAKGKNIDNDANAQLNWLHAQLQAAKAHHEKVFIAMHIPEGVDIYATLRTRLVRLFTLWKPQYVKRFDAEIKLFSPEISGIFMAHLHSNWLSILTFENNEIPQMVTTSVSPIFGNDPGFRLFSYSPALQLQSITNYFYLLKRKEWESTENTI